MQDDYFYYMNVVKPVTNLLVLLSVYNVRVLMPTETTRVFISTYFGCILACFDFLFVLYLQLVSLRVHLEGELKCKNLGGIG